MDTASPELRNAIAIILSDSPLVDHCTAIRVIPTARERSLAFELLGGVALEIPEIMVIAERLKVKHGL